MLDTTIPPVSPMSSIPQSKPEVPKSPSTPSELFQLTAAPLPGDVGSDCESSASSETFPSLSLLEDYNRLGLDKSLVDDPPCSNSLICAFETLTTAGLRSTTSLRPSANHLQSKKLCSYQPSVLHEVVASTKRHFVTNRVQYKDSDGTKMTYQANLSITPHDQGENVNPPTAILAYLNIVCLSGRSGDVHS